VILVSRILETKLAEFPHYQLIEIHEIHQISVHTVVASDPPDRCKSTSRGIEHEPFAKCGGNRESGDLRDHVRGVVSVSLHRGSGASDHRIALQTLHDAMWRNSRRRNLPSRFRHKLLIL
jgi:hypothetical protein